MRMFKLLCAMALVLAFCMIGVATASAAETLWPFLPGTVGETFTGKLHEKTKAFLQEEGGARIECAAASILLETSILLKNGSTEGKDATLWLATIHFSGCKALGLEVHTKGDEKEILLVHIEGHNCLIEWLKVAKLDGVLILPLEVVILSGKGETEKVITTVLDKAFEEGGKKLSTAFVAPLKKIGVSEYLLDARQTEGKQEVEKCEGSEVTDRLKTLLNGAAKETNAGEEVKAILLFDKTFDKEETLS